MTLNTHSSQKWNKTTTTTSECLFPSALGISLCDVDWTTCYDLFSSPLEFSSSWKHSCNDCRTTRMVQQQNLTILIARPRTVELPARPTSCTNTNSHLPVISGWFIHYQLLYLLLRQNTGMMPWKCGFVAKLKPRIACLEQMVHASTRFCIWLASICGPVEPGHIADWSCSLLNEVTWTLKWSWTLGISNIRIIFKLSN